jgi:hypothetical protein
VTDGSGFLIARIVGDGNGEPLRPEPSGARSSAPEELDEDFAARPGDPTVAWIRAESSCCMTSWWWGRTPASWCAAPTADRDVVFVMVAERGTEFLAAPVSGNPKVVAAEAPRCARDHGQRGAGRRRHGAAVAGRAPVAGGA